MSRCEASISIGRVKLEYTMVKYMDVTQLMAGNPKVGDSLSYRCGPTGIVGPTLSQETVTLNSEIRCRNVLAFITFSDSVNM